MRGSTLFAAVVCTSVLAPSALAQEQISDSGMSCTFTIPHGWREMPPQMLAQYNGAARMVGAGGGETRYDRGFHITWEGQNEPSAYILMQRKAGRVRATDIDDIEQSITGLTSGPEMAEMKGKMKPWVSDVSLGTPTFDRNTGRVMMPMKAQVGFGGPKVRGVSHGFVGAGGVVFLHCYAEEGDWKDMQSEFSQVADSFEYAEGSTFADALSGGGMMESIVRYAIVGGIVGGVGALMGQFRKKRDTLTA